MGFGGGLPGPGIPGPGLPGGDVQRLANWLGHDLHISSSGTLSRSARETVAENIRGEDGTNPVTGGNCGQNPDRVPDRTRRK